MQSTYFISVILIIQKTHALYNAHNDNRYIYLLGECRTIESKDE